MAARQSVLGTWNQGQQRDAAESGRQGFEKPKVKGAIKRTGKRSCEGIDGEERGRGMEGKDNLKPAGKRLSGSDDGF